jgi:hypothetical protein
MAINLVQRGRILNVPVAVGKVTGSPTVVGPYPGVCVNSRGAGAGPAVNADVEFDREFVIYDLEVEAVDIAAPNAVVFGDVLYYDGTDILNKANNGEEYGVALEAIAAGTDFINVMLMSSG